MLLTEVASRLYEWSFREAEREHNAGLSLVKQIGGRNADKYVRFFSQLPSDEVIPTSCALVKRMNQPVLLRQKPTLTVGEQRRVETYLRFGEGGGLSRGSVGHDEVQPPPAKRTVELRRGLRALLRDRFRKEFGTGKRDSPNEWFYETDLKSIRIHTHLDVGGWYSLRYSHTIFQNDVQLRAQLSMLQWLGAASATNWGVLRAEELHDAADAVLALCKHFVGEMSELFE